MYKKHTLSIFKFFCKKDVEIFVNILDIIAKYMLYYVY
jgi:hypothetical protein